MELACAGVPVEEVMFVYEMNRGIVAEVDTPSGITQTFNVKEAVRQGSVFGPTLCGISTNRINKIGKDHGVIMGNVMIKCPIFVDDIVGMGRKEDIEEIGEKMNTLEKTKKFVFNNKKDKSEILVMKNNKKEEKKEVNIEVRKGKINTTMEYKYLGDYYNINGDNKTKIERRMKKAKYMAHEVKRKGSTGLVGNADVDVRMKLLEAVVKPSLLANMETWSRV